MNEEVNGVVQDKTWFEASNRGDIGDFKKFEDGTFRVAVKHGIEYEHSVKMFFYMNTEQFAAFKKWVMEN